MLPIPRSIGLNFKMNSRLTPLFSQLFLKRISLAMLEQHEDESQANAQDFRAIGF